MSRRRTVIIFKSESESSDAYAELLAEHNFQPIFVPTLSFGFKNLEQLAAKLQTPDKYAGIIFTSPRCVEAVDEALQHAEMPAGWTMLHNYAVGEVTHNMALSTLQQLFTHGKQTGTARGLADFIVDTFDGSRSLPLLLPCSNLAQDTLLTRLSANGFELDPVEVYETKCNPELAEKMDRALKPDDDDDAEEGGGSGVEYLAFFSPSGVNCCHAYFAARNISLDAWKLIAIGPSTRRAMEEKGMTVFRTAEKPSVEYLIKVLINTDE